MVSFYSIFIVYTGLKVSPPDFMRPRRGRKKQVVEEIDSEDEEWKPKRAKKKSRGLYRFICLNYSQTNSAHCEIAPEFLRIVRSNRNDAELLALKRPRKPLRVKDIFYQ